MEDFEILSFTAAYRQFHVVIHLAMTSMLTELGTPPNIHKPTTPASVSLLVLLSTVYSFAESWNDSTVEEFF